MALEWMGISENTQAKREKNSKAQDGSVESIEIMRKC